MSIIVSVKINDGVVMAADSATTFAIGQIYEHANKVVNLVKGFPVGVMTCGAAGIGNASIATLLKDLRQRLSGKEAAHLDWKLDESAYTMEAVAKRVHEFFAEQVKSNEAPVFMLLRICGYSSGRLLPEVWQVAFDQSKLLDPSCVQPEDNFGPRWNGETEALDRMIIGIGSASKDGLQTLNITPAQFVDAKSKLAPYTYQNLILPAAPIQDAIDLARFMVDVTKGFIRFSVSHPKTVGGPVEVAVITKHEGFKWVQRKHFYSVETNPS